MIEALKTELEKPKDEELAQAYEKIERLRQHLSDLNRKSLITLTDEWKLENAKDLFSQRFSRKFCSTCGGGLKL